MQILIFDSKVCKLGIGGSYRYPHKEIFLAVIREGSKLLLPYRELLFLKPK